MEFFCYLYFYRNFPSGGCVGALTLYAYRTSENSSKGLFPYFLMYGREPNELTPYHNRISQSIDMNADTYHELVRKKLAEAREYVEAKMAQHHNVPNTI